ncbi:multidrug-resistance type transporter aminotriazole resistance [Elasticomyces elasticus]|uniref:Multidrug-resistance type transporter aminotriazole resistance n=1 Tax=Elasticomyces elasticus TaxID=574655 RepID=A0AAN7WFP6_9PEZI|nr:multidrug-resistance type transporter aminotriazole resistance [Elasticomyces elasticus]
MANTQQDLPRTQTKFEEKLPVLEPETTLHTPTATSTPTVEPLPPTKREDEVPPIPDDSDGDADSLQPTRTQDSEMRRTASLNKAVSLPREILVVGIICLSQLTTQVGFSNTLVLLHVIGRSFEITNPGKEAWLVAGYSLTVGTFILVFGRMGDVFGYKRMLVIGYTWFALWSMVAGLAIYSNYVLFVFARVLQGIGPAICLPNGLALLGALYEPGNRKNMCFAIFGACAPGGSILGAAAGGVFALAWWPWTFWSFAITLAITAFGAAFLIPDPQVKVQLPRTVRGFVEELDLYAATVGILSLILFNFAWNQAPISGWGTPSVCVCLVLGVLLVPVFFYLELKVSPNPLIPFSLFTSTNAFVLSCIACGWANFGIFALYFFNILQVLRGTSPLLTAAYLSPFVISGAAAALLTGFLLSHLRPAWLMVIAMCAFLAGNLILTTVPPHQIYWGQFFVTTLIAPFGMDMSFPAATLYLSNSIEKSKQGVAASLVMTIVNYSISLGLGFAGTVEVNVNNGGTTRKDVLTGYRGALYMGTGLSGFGLAISIAFVAKTYWDDHKVRQQPADLETKREDLD